MSFKKYKTKDYWSIKSYSWKIKLNYRIVYYTPVKDKSWGEIPYRNKAFFYACYQSDIHVGFNPWRY